MPEAPARPTGTGAAAASPPGPAAVHEHGDIAPGLLTEHLADGWGYFIRSRALLERFQSRYQAVEVHDSAAFGRLFRLDGHFMTSERDEFFYHENLVHLAGLAHAGAQRALIVGGGDGGSAKELLKYPSMRSITLCEIDPTVVEISRRHLTAVHRGALDDTRVEVRIGDGLAFVRDTDRHYDLIVLDLTDPGGPSTPLYTAPFYRACRARLSPGGAMTLHIASPIAHPERIRAGLQNLRAAFPVVTPYLTSIPLYGGMWMMACAAESLDPGTVDAREVDRRLAARGIADLQYYNGAVHAAALALPNFVRDLVA